MNRSFDILGLGCVAVDDLLYVPSYPPADAKVRVRRRERQCGGLTGTALVAASRLGARCAFAGVLGSDELSTFVANRLRNEGIDTSHIRTREGARPIHSSIVVDESNQTRTIFYDLDGVFGAESGWPSAELIRSVGLLYVDHFGIEGMTWAARIAREAGVAVVADFEEKDWPGFPELLELVDHLIISLDFARRLCGEAQGESAAIKLWNGRQRAVVVTDGGAGCWYLHAGEPRVPRHLPAFRVEVVDTTGCGDVFHGAYAAALVQGREIAECVRFASAAAALKATRTGGQAGIPTRAAVDEFLRKGTV
jgi:sulfofructose kinase